MKGAVRQEITKSFAVGRGAIMTRPTCVPHMATTNIPRIETRTMGSVVLGVSAARLQRLKDRRDAARPIRLRDRRQEGSPDSATRAAKTDGMNSVKVIALI